MNKRGKNKYFSHYDFFPKNRRGSHVEVIISFIIFVTFILFIFSIVEPSISTQKDKKNMFEGVDLKIIGEVSSNMTTITVNFGGGSGGCVDLDNLNIGKNIVVKDAYGEGVSSSADDNSLEINGESGETFFKIYYSEEFDELDGSGCSPTSYDLGLTKTSKYIFQKKVMELISRDYETLKTEFNISEGVDFGYGIILSNGTTIETNQEQLPTNVYIRETPIEYVDLDGNILEGYLKTRIW
jgi:hypothetical protein